MSPPSRTYSRKPYMVGKGCRLASSTMVRLFGMVSECAKTMSPSAPAATISPNAASKSRMARTAIGRRIIPRPRAAFDRIAAERHDNGNRARGLLRGTDRWPAAGHDDIQVHSSELGREAQELLAIWSHAPLDRDVLAFDVAEFPKALDKGSRKQRGLARLLTEKPNAVRL